MLNKITAMLGISENEKSNRAELDVCVSSQKRRKKLIY